MKPKFLKYLTGFPKNHDIQHVVLKMIETRRDKLNASIKVGVKGF